MGTKFIIAMLIVGLLTPMPVWAGNGKKHFKQGQALEADKQFDRAAEEYMAALGEEENNIEYRIAYQRAATQASVMLVRQGREALEQGQYEEAYNSFRRAYQFDKTNELAADLATQALNLQRKTAGIAPVPVTETPYGATIPIIGQNPRSGASPQRPAPPAKGSAEAPEKDKVRQDITFRNRELEEIITDLAEQIGLNVMFDATFRSRKINVKLKNVTLAQALDTILLSNNLFFEPINESTIIISVDNTANRARLQQMSVQTFYLKSADPQIVQTQLTALFGQRIMVVPNAELRSVTVRTTPETLKLVNNMVSALDKDKPEVLIDVSIYEVSRSGMLEIGNQLLYDGFFRNAPTGPLRPSSLNTLAVTTGQILTQGKLMVAVPTTVLRMLQTRGNSRLLDSLQVHALDGQPATANIGQRIPIQTASLPSSFATVQPNQQQFNPQNPQQTTDRFINSLSLGVPQIQYQNVGLNVKVTPTIYSDDDVKLDMDIETSGFVDGPTPLTPIFTQRSLKSVSTIKTGQAAMMAAVAQNRVRTSRQSLPVIGFLPVLGRFFSVPSQSNDNTDLLITVTPHVIRKADIREEDRQAMSSGLQLMGVSESVESFIERREQARLQRQQAASPSEITKTSPPPAPAPAVTVNLPAAATASDGPGASALVRPVSSPGLVPASSLVAENTAPVVNQTEVGIVNVQFQPTTTQPRVGETLRVMAFARSTQPIQRGNLMLRFDPAVLRVRTVADGGLLAAEGQGARMSVNLDITGAVIIAIETAGKVPDKPGQAPLVVIDFDVISPGNSVLATALEVTKFMRPDGNEMRVASVPVAISVK